MAVLSLISLLALLAFSRGAVAGPSEAMLAEKGEGADRRLILENGFIRAAISPSQGGRVVSLIHKRSKRELTVAPTRTRRGGLLSDQVWQQNYWHGDWNRSTYEYEVVERGPAAAKVRMWCKGPRWDHVTFQRTTTLRNDRSSLQVDYEITGGKTSQPRRGLPDFWFHNTLARPGKAFMPSPTGVRVRPAARERDSWVYDPTHGWIAYVSDQGAGMTATMDFARVRCLRAMHEPDQTLEWIHRRVDLEPGEKIQTSVSLGFFSGLKEVTGACESAAAAMSVGEPDDGQVPVSVALAAFADLAADLALTVRRLPDVQPVPVAAKQIALKADTVANLEFSVPVAGRGTFVIQGLLRQGERLLLTFEKDLVAGKPSGVYAVAPQAPRIPEQGYGSTKSLIRPFDLDFSSLAVETPHLKWAKPCAVGRLRVLALVNDRMEREVIEIAQRFDIDLTTCFLVGSTHWRLGDGIYLLKKPLMDAQVLEQLKKEWDLIIVRALPSGAKDATDTWVALPEQARTRIAELVAEGTGLWLTRTLLPMELDEKAPWEEPLEGDVVPWKIPATYAPLRKGALGCCGEGRVIRGVPLAARVRVDRRTTALDYWEYHYALVGQLLYWAVGFELPVNLEKIECTRSSVSVRLYSLDDETAKVRIRVRDEFGNVLTQRDLDAELAEDETTQVTLPLGKREGSAAHVADLIVLDEDGRALTWGAQTFPERKPLIRRWQPEEIAFAREGEARLTATIKGQLPPNAKLSIELLDGANRRVAAAETTASANTTVTLPLHRATGYIFQARATLHAEDTILDQAVCEGHINVPERRRLDKFHTYFWGGAGLGVMPPHMAYDLYTVYRDAGVNCNWGDKYPGQNSWAFDRLNMTFEVASVGMRFKGLTKQEMESSPDARGGIGDPATAVGLRERGAEVARQYRHANIFMYGCADENPGPGKDVSFNPPALAEFRRWLRDTQYKSLSGLNQEWQTEFETWEAVMPMTEAEVKEHGRDAGSYAAWADQRQFNKWSYASFAKAFTEGVRSADPDALVGASGTQESSAYSGRDWWLLARAYTGLSAYGGTQTREQMAFNPSLIRHSWMGYNKDNPRLRNGMWGCISDQNYGFGIFSDRTHIDPDYTLPMHGRELKAALEEMKRGAGQMLVSAKRVWDQVYLLQSPASIHGAYITGQDKLHRGTVHGLMRMLGDLHVAYRAISYEQLAQGKLAEFGARVLLLPHMVALSGAQCRRIQEWVSAGGTIIADLTPGVMTEHCRLLEKGQLDDLFGIDRSEAQLTEGKWELRPPGAPADSQPYPAGTIETGIRTKARALWTAASAKGESTPIFFHRPVGKGHAFYLACDALAHYGRVRGKALSDEERPLVESYLNLFSKAFAQAGHKPVASASLLDPETGNLGSRCPYVNLYAKDDGPARYYSVIRDVYIANQSPPDTLARIAFDRTGYIYDVLGQKLLGRGNSVDLTFTKYTLRLCAVLPYRVDEMKLTVSSARLRQGDELTLSAQLATTGGKPERHWFRLDVIRPAGRLDLAYSRNVEAKGGRAEIAIPFALNDPPGKWTIIVQDVVSGEQARVSVDLAGE